MSGVYKFCLWLMLTVAASEAMPSWMTRRRGQLPDTNFLSTRMTTDGEFEVRISYDGIHAIETVVPELGEQGLFFREATNGKQIVHSIYQTKDVLVDCDVSRDEEDLGKFWERYLGTSSRFHSSFHARTGNLTMREIDGPLEDRYKPLVNFHQLKTECRELHRYLRQQRKAKKHEATGENALLKPHDADYKDQWNLDDEEEGSSEGTESQESSRVKRAMLIYPGTNWCGTGNTATSYHDLGENVATDKCCRAHDHCPYIIDGFSTKYNLFNYHFHTLSHCSCDETFRSCLKNAGNSVANVVGSLFFNVVGTKCFILKPEKTCIERSWWGRCQEYSRQYTAYIDEPAQY